MMAFHLSGKVVALHLDNSTAKAYLCNQGGTVSPFLSRLACWILSLTNKHGMTLLPAYIPTHFNVGADFLSWDWLLPEWHLLPQVAQAAFHLWGLSEVDLLASSHSTQCQHYFTLGTPLHLGALGLNAFSHSWNFQASYVFPPLTCQWSTQTFTSGGSMLDGGSLASHSSQHAGRCSLAVSSCKRSCFGCFGRPGTQGPAISALTLCLLSNVCYADRSSLPQSVRQWQGQLEHLCQGSTSSAGRSGLGGVLDRVYQTMPSLPLN